MLPGTVQGLVLARVDRLNEIDKLAQDRRVIAPSSSLDTGGKPPVKMTYEAAGHLHQLEELAYASGSSTPGKNPLTNSNTPSHRKFVTRAYDWVSVTIASTVASALKRWPRMPSSILLTTFSRSGASERARHYSCCGG